MRVSLSISYTLTVTLNPHSPSLPLAEDSPQDSPMAVSPSSNTTKKMAGTDDGEAFEASEESASSGSDDSLVDSEDDSDVQPTLVDSQERISGLEISSRAQNVMKYGQNSAQEVPTLHNMAHRK